MSWYQSCAIHDCSISLRLRFPSLFFLWNLSIVANYISNVNYTDISKFKLKHVIKLQPREQNTRHICHKSKIQNRRRNWKHNKGVLLINTKFSQRICTLISLSLRECWRDTIHSLLKSLLIIKISLLYEWNCWMLFCPSQQLPWSQNSIRRFWSHDHSKAPNLLKELKSRHRECQSHLNVPKSQRGSYPNGPAKASKIRFRGILHSWHSHQHWSNLTSLLVRSKSLPNGTVLLNTHTSMTKNTISHLDIR